MSKHPPNETGAPSWADLPFAADNEFAVARRKMGLTVEYCAATVGLEVSHYVDLELHKDEFARTISLGTARRLCKLMDLDLVRMLDELGLLGPSDLKRSASTEFWCRHLLIGRRRESMGLSQAALADQAGLFSWAIASLERNADTIESLNIPMVIDLAKVLSLDPRVLIGCSIESEK